jgi:hypothetical protein
MKKWLFELRPEGDHYSIWISATAGLSSLVHLPITVPKGEAEKEGFDFLTWLKEELDHSEWKLERPDQP